MSTEPYRDAKLSPEERVQDLLPRMTLEEKLAQLGAVWGKDLLEGRSVSEERLRSRLRHGIGHVSRLASSATLLPREVAAATNRVQRFLLERTRLGIPAIVHEESCAGFLARGATQFPQSIGLASTWMPELAERMARVIRSQMLAVGARQSLAPVLDVVRDPRWGRCEETFGEDPYLAARFGVAYVRGLQGSDLRYGVAATGKHFAGYGFPEGGLNWAPAWLPERELRERVLPPFAAAVREAGLASVMNGYHEIDGVPCAASRWLLDEVLRLEMGFSGVVVADYYAVECLESYHRVAADRAEAAATALEAGLDVELPEANCFGAPLAQACREGRVPLALVDRAVARVLRLKFSLGLFDDPFVDESVAERVFDTQEQRALAREIAEKSVVLLSNEGVLPLDPAPRVLAVVGPNAHSVRNVQGDYHYPAHLEIFFGAVEEGEFRPAPRGEADLDPLSECFPRTVTVLEGLRSWAPPGCEVRYARGCGVLDGEDREIREAVELVRHADVAVVVAGDRSGLVRGATSGEGIDRATLGLPGRQGELVREVCATGTPTVVVLVNGRPLVLTEVASRAAAIVEAWLPAEEAGNAVARVLFGRVSPGGRLPVSLPRSVGQLPVYYGRKPSSGRSQFYGEYTDESTSPLFPFGHGLSYTRFEYDGLGIAPEEVGAFGFVEVACRVANVGARAGEEVVQLYVHDPVASVTRPRKVLAGFLRVSLEPGQAKRVHFRLPVVRLAFYDRAGEFVVEPGEVEVYVGASSEDIRLRGRFRIGGKRTVLPRWAVPPTEARVS